MLCNPELMKLAEWKLRNRAEKLAALNKESAVPAAGGMPPPGPQAGPQPGGAPPPGGGQPQGGGGDISSMIQTAVQQATAHLQPQGGMGGPGAAAGGMGKPAKPDINTVANDIFQVKKLLTHLFNHQQIPLPPDILDGPNRDPASGAPMPPGAAGSTSDPATQSAGTPGTPPGGAQAGPISPIKPMAAGMPQAGGGQAKAASDLAERIGFEHGDRPGSIGDRADALATLIRFINSK